MLQENAVQHMACGQMHNIIWGTNSALAWIVIDMLCIIHTVTNDSSQTVGHARNQATHLKQQ